MNILKSKINFFYFLLFLIVFLKSILYFFIPINVLGNAPHDDYLFYRLGESISNFSWLGNYDQLTLIKGPVYPLFLSFSIFFNIPLRILEVFISSLSIIYFIFSISHLIKEKKLLIIIFILLSFFPFVLTALEYRILRDSIYIYLLLFIISDFIFLATNDISKIKSIILRFFSLGFFLALFTLTREEGVWILPTFLIFIFIFILKNFRKNKIVIFSLLILFFSYFSTNSIFSLTNKFFYKSTILNTFKDSNFDYGYSSLYRIKHDSTINRVSVPFDAWDKIFSISDTANKLSNYIYGPAYKNWMLTACDAIRRQHPDENNPDCENEMLVGYLMMALIDALYDAGFNSPSKVSDAMKDIGDDISEFCNTNNQDCIKLPKKMMPPSTFNLITLDKTIRKFPHSINVLINSHNNHPDNIKGSGSADLIKHISNNLNSYIFNYKSNINDIDYDIIAKPTSKLTKKAEISKITFDNETIIFEGSNDSEINFGVVILDQKYQCKLQNEGVKLNCLIPNAFSFPVAIEAYLYDDNFKYQIPIKTSLKNISHFDEECYLRMNPDVNFAVKNKDFSSGLDHWNKFGKHENRECSPSIFFNAKEIDNINYHSNKNDIAINIIQKLYNFYTLLLKLGIFFIIIYLINIFKTRDLANIAIFLILSSLIFSRVSLISLLDITGLAPVTGLYLLSGTFSLFILISLSIIYCVKKYYK